MKGRLLLAACLAVLAMDAPRDSYGSKYKTTKETTKEKKTKKEIGIRKGIGGKLSSASDNTVTGNKSTTDEEIVISKKNLELGSQAAGSHAAETQNAAKVIKVSAAAHASAAGTGRFPVVIPPIEGLLPKLSSQKPGLLFVTVDHSQSMGDPFARTGRTKAYAVADTVNQVLQEFVDGNNAGGVIKERVDVLLNGYGNEVTSLLAGQLQGRDIVSVKELAENTVDDIMVKDGENQLVPHAIWVRPVVDQVTGMHGNTPMRSNFATLREKVASWKRRPQGDHLVIGVHVTDGDSTDGDPQSEVSQLAQEVSARGGKLLLTNIHLSSNGSVKDAVIFPDEADAARLDEHGQMLFKISSPVPPELAQKLRTKPGARMMAYNTNLEQFARVFEAGSSAAAK